MAPWYEVLCLVGSNVFLLPVIVLCCHPKVKLFDIAAYAFQTFFSSVVYHLAQTDVYHFENYDYAQNADHISVNTFMFVTILLFLQIPLEYRVVFTVIMQTLMLNFTGHLVARLNFHYAFIFLAVVGFFVRFYVIPGRPRRYGITYIAIGGLLWAISLVFFFFNDGVGQPNYWWAHSGWHVTSMMATVFVIVGFIFHVRYVWENGMPKIKKYFDF